MLVCDLRLLFIRYACEIKLQLEADKDAYPPQFLPPSRVHNVLFGWDMSLYETI